MNVFHGLTVIFCHLLKSKIKLREECSSIFVGQKKPEFVEKMPFHKPQFTFKVLLFILILGSIHCRKSGSFNSEEKGAVERKEVCFKYRSVLCF